MRSHLSACLFLLGCASAFGQTDAFPEKLKGGCKSEVECRRLVTEAKARVTKCQPNTIGYIRCGDAQADLEIAQGYLRELEIQRAEREKADQDAQRKRAEEERERQYREREEARARKEAEAVAQREERVRQRAEQAETLWKSIDVKKCSDSGDSTACLALEEYLRSFQDAPHAPEARIALRAGREAQYRREEREQAAQDAAAAKAAREAPKPKRAKCCDGSFDAGCGCSGGDGCCFRRGGVCGCE